MEVSIRKLQEEDAQISFAWRNNPEIWKYTGSRPDRTITPEMEKAWINAVINRPDELRFAIIADEEYVGNIYLTNIHDGSAVYHIFIGETRYWGKGVAFQASSQLIALAKSIGLSKISLKVHHKNLQAIRLYEKLGFHLLHGKNIDSSFYNMEITI